MTFYKSGKATLYLYFVNATLYYFCLATVYIGQIILLVKWRAKVKCLRKVNCHAEVKCSHKVKCRTVVKCQQKVKWCIQVKYRTWLNPRLVYVTIINWTSRQYLVKNETRVKTYSLFEVFLMIPDIVRTTVLRVKVCTYFTSNVEKVYFCSELSKKSIFDQKCRKSKFLVQNLKNLKFGQTFLK